MTFGAFHLRASSGAPRLGLLTRLFAALLIPTLLIAAAVLYRTSVNLRTGDITSAAVDHNVRAVALTNRLDERAAVLRTLM
ncbi:MAG TPA: hypothetical protein VNM48_07405 [Chloroflexota bacterium]|nr:hypothetical protein [Chloroflexota bacterium]